MVTHPVINQLGGLWLRAIFDLMVRDKPRPTGLSFCGQTTSSFGGSCSPTQLLNNWRMTNFLHWLLPWQYESFTPCSVPLCSMDRWNCNLLHRCANLLWVGPLSQFPLVVRCGAILYLLSRLCARCLLLMLGRALANLAIIKHMTTPQSICQNEMSVFRIRNLQNHTWSFGRERLLQRIYHCSQAKLNSSSIDMKKSRLEENSNPRHCEANRIQF